MITIVRPYEPPPDYPFDDEASDENELKRGDSTALLKKKEPPIHPSNLSKRTCIDGNEMLRTRQYPEVAGLYCGDEQVPALRRFTRYNQSMSQREHPPSTILVQSSGTNGKSSKKSHFNFGNWTFREKKPSRPGLPIEMQPRRNERPASVNLSDVRGLRSRSEGGRLIEERPKEESPPKDYSCRIPIRVERVPLQESVRSLNNRVFFRSQPPPQQKVPAYPPNEDLHTRLPTSQANKFKSETSLDKNSSSQENDSLCTNLGEHRISKKRNRRRDKTRDAWRAKEIRTWTLDDILVWLQAIRLDEVASLFVGYDLKGPDLDQWNHQVLAQLGVNDLKIRSTILNELELVRKVGPVKDGEKGDRQTSMFDLVRNTEFDQVLAFETALTPRDLSVTGGRMGCLQVTKVDGSCLPFKENDCLLEINGVSGEQFKSALMLTKLISDTDGQPIRFVILRRKEREDDSTSQTDSSSGISSSPLTPVDHAV